MPSSAASAVPLAVVAPLAVTQLAAGPPRARPGRTRSLTMLNALRIAGTPFDGRATGGAHPVARDRRRRRHRRARPARLRRALPRAARALADRRLRAAAARRRVPRQRRWRSRSRSRATPRSPRRSSSSRSAPSRRRRTARSRRCSSPARSSHPARRSSPHSGEHGQNPDTRAAIATVAADWRDGRRHGERRAARLRRRAVVLRRQAAAGRARARSTAFETLAAAVDAPAAVRRGDEGDRLWLVADPPMSAARAATARSRRLGYRRDADRASSTATRPCSSSARSGVPRDDTQAAVGAAPRRARRGLRRRAVPVLAREQLARPRRAGLRLLRRRARQLPRARRRRRPALDALPPAAAAPAGDLRRRRLHPRLRGGRGDGRGDAARRARHRLPAHARPCSTTAGWRATSTGATSCRCATTTACGASRAARARAGRPATSTPRSAETDGEIIVVLDADHLARPELCEMLLGYFARPRHRVRHEPAVLQARQRRPARPPGGALLQRDPAGQGSRQRGVLVRQRRRLPARGDRGARRLLGVEPRRGPAHVLRAARARLEVGLRPGPRQRGHRAEHGRRDGQPAAALGDGQPADVLLGQPAAQARADACASACTTCTRRAGTSSPPRTSCSSSARSPRSCSACGCSCPAPRRRTGCCSRSTSGRSGCCLLRTSAGAGALRMAQTQTFLAPVFALAVWRAIVSPPRRRARSLRGEVTPQDAPAPGELDHDLPARGAGRCCSSRSASRSPARGSPRGRSWCGRACSRPRSRRRAACSACSATRPSRCASRSRRRRWPRPCSWR